MTQDDNLDHLQFHQATDSDSDSWDQFVSANSGSVYQLYFWQKIFQKVYSYKSKYFKIYKNKKWIGILPAIERGSIYSKLVSLPFVDEAGWLAVEPITPKIFQWLNQKVSSYEIFSKISNGDELNDKESSYKIYSLAPDKYERIFSKYHLKTRNMVRKAQKSGFTGSVAPITEDQVDRFYNLYVSTMKKVGTLTLSGDFFKELFKNTKNLSYISVAYHESKVVSMLWLFLHNKKLYVWANAYDLEYLSSGANYFVYDLAIAYACDNNLNEIVLGASGENSSQSFFKERWGAIGKDVYLYSSNESAATMRWEFLRKSKILIRLLPKSLYVLFSNTILKYLS